MSINQLLDARGRVLQIVDHDCPRVITSGLNLVPMPGPHQKRRGPNRPSQFQVADVVANHEAASWVEMVVGPGLLDQARSRLAAVAVVIRHMGTEINAIYDDAFVSEHCLKEIVNTGESG